MNLVWAVAVTVLVLVKASAVVAYGVACWRGRGE